MDSRETDGKKRALVLCLMFNRDLILSRENLCLTETNVVSRGFLVCWIQYYGKLLIASSGCITCMYVYFTSFSWWQYGITGQFHLLPSIFLGSAINGGAVISAHIWEYYAVDYAFHTKIPIQIPVKNIISKHFHTCINHQIKLWSK